MANKISRRAFLRGGAAAAALSTPLCAFFFEDLRKLLAPANTIYSVPRPSENELLVERAIRQTAGLSNAGRLNDAQSERFIDLVVGHMQDLLRKEEDEEVWYFAPEEHIGQNG